MSWLRKRMRYDPPSKTRIDVHHSGHPMKFRAAPSRSTALGLVCQAAEIIKNVDDHAAETQALAETLAEKALEELKAAQARVRTAESKQQATEANLRDLMSKVQEVEVALERVVSRLAVAEEQVSTAEQRARLAQCALIRIEQALSAGHYDEIADLRNDKRNQAVVENTDLGPLPSCVVNQRSFWQRGTPI